MTVLKLIFLRVLYKFWIWLIYIELFRIIFILSYVKSLFMKEGITKQKMEYKQYTGKQKAERN